MLYSRIIHITDWNWMTAAAWIVGPAIGWMAYYDFKDRYQKEPRLYLILAYALGFAGAIPCLWFYIWSERWVTPSQLSMPLLFLYCVAWVGVIEEGSKFAALRLTVLRSKHFDEPIDGIIYGAMAGIGFASFENILYFRHMAGWELIGRAIASPLVHSLFSALWGYCISHGRFVKRKELRWTLIGLGAAALTHGGYDYFLLTGNRTYWAAIIIVALWLILLVRIRILHTRWLLPGTRHASANVTYGNTRYLK